MAKTAQRRKWSGWGILLAVCCLGLGCGNPAIPPGNTSKDTGAAAQNSLNELQRIYADIIEGFPDNPRSEEIMNLLRAAGRKEGVDTDEALMYRCAKNCAGASLFESCLKKRLTTSPESSEELCREALNKAPDTMLAAMALDRLLERVQSRDSEEFLKLCETYGSKDAYAPQQRVALLRRSEYWLARNDRRAATLDALEVLGSCSDPAAQSGVVERVGGIIMESGYLLEAEWLASSQEKTAVAAAIRSDFLRVAKGAGGPSDAQDAAGFSSLTDRYLQEAPNFSALFAALPAQDAPPCDRLCFLLRLIGLSCNKAEVDNVVSVLRILSDPGARPALGALTDEETVLSAGLAETAAKRAAEVLTDLDYTRSLRPDERDSVRPSDAHSLLASLSALRLELAFECSRRQNDPSALQSAGALEKHVAVLNRIGFHSEAIAAFDDFAQRYPEAPLTPGILLKKAAYYADVLKAPREAATTYGQLRNKYPQSTEAREAGLKAALALYSAKEYEDAYSGLQELLTEKLEPNDKAAAEFLSAMCESAMGQNDLAKEHMELVVKNWRQDPIASRALLWLAYASLSETDYVQAKKHLDLLIEEYPASKEAESAREYLDRLTKIKG